MLRNAMNYMCLEKWWYNVKYCNPKQDGNEMLPENVTFEERPEAGKSEWSAYVEIKLTLGCWVKPILTEDIISLYYLLVLYSVNSIFTFSYYFELSE
jgi:hypothetical protein